MAVYKRGKTYWYAFRFNGQRHQGSAKTKNLTIARRIEAKVKTDLALALHGMLPMKPAPPLKDYAEQFKEFIAVHNADHPATIAFYEEKLGHLLDFKPLAGMRLNLIGEDTVEKYIQWRSGSVALASVNRDLATLRRLLRVAWNKHKLIRGIPDITLLPGETGREFVLGYDQEQAYLKVAEDTLRDFAVLSLDTGVRAGEGMALEWEDVHLEPANGARFGYIHIRKGKTKNAKRILSMTPRVKAMLENRRAFGPKHQFVFQSPRKRDGKPAALLVSSLDHQHVRARKTATVKVDDQEEKLPPEFVVHSLRHTFATRLGESGADAFEIMRIMGHSSVTISQKYVHPTPDSLERVFERLDAMNIIMRGGNKAGEALGLSTDSTTAVKNPS